MRRDWFRFYWPMVALVVALTGVTWAVSLIYGDTFWDAFYPHLLAVVFGVVISIMFTWALWRYQSGIRRSESRQQLIRDLKIEVDENIERIEEMDRGLTTGNVQNGIPPEVVEFDMFGGISVGDCRIRFLRTVAVEQFAKIENLLLVRNLDLEEKINWLLWRCNQYNTALSNAFIEFNTDLQSDKDMKQVISQLHKRISPGVRFLQHFLKDLSQELGAIAER